MILRMRTNTNRYSQCINTQPFGIPNTFRMPPEDPFFNIYMDMTNNMRYLMSYNKQTTHE